MCNIHSMREGFPAKMWEISIKYLRSLGGSIDIVMLVHESGVHNVVHVRAEDLHFDYVSLWGVFWVKL